jgi:hypothetical protein
MDPYLNAVRTVTGAKDAIRTSVTEPTPDLLRLSKTCACETCMAFLRDHTSMERVPDDDDDLRLRGLRLLFTIAAMQEPNDHARREQLCLLGTRGVDAYQDVRPERRRKAAAARKRPLRDIPWYVQNHLPRTQERLAGQLQALVEHPALLNEALSAHGEVAMVRFL